MQQGRLEHVNVTVADPARTAALLEAVFDWQIRWQGPSIHGGHTIHIGTESDYLAIYTHGSEQPEPTDRDRSYTTQGALNHVGVVVEDLDAVEAKVVELGLSPFNHQQYDPGRRFYFLDYDGIEYEVVSYH